MAEPACPVEGCNGLLRYDIVSDWYKCQKCGTYCGVGADQKPWVLKGLYKPDEPAPLTP